MINKRFIFFGLSIVIILAVWVAIVAFLPWPDLASDDEISADLEASPHSLVDRLATIDPGFLTRPPTVGPSPTTQPAADQALALTTPIVDQEPQPEPVSHIVQPGDNLFRISQRYGITVEDIMQANGLTVDGLIYAGQTLIIPTGMTGSSESDQISAIDITPQNPTSIPVTDTPLPLTETPLPLSDTPLPPTETPPSPTETPLPATETPPPPTETLFPPTDTPLLPTDTPLLPTETTAPNLPVLSTINGIPLESFFLMPANVQENVRAIFAVGQALGRNPRAFSKVGDSTIENPHFLARFDEGPYNLGEYAYLQGAIDRFAGSHSRQGLAVRRGNHSWTVTDPMWADKSICQTNETPIDCEIRVHNPSILIIRLGSNDRGVPSGFEHNLRQVVQNAIDKGVIPILGTKADRFEGSNINNDIIRQVAFDFQVPLWDFDRLAGTIPGRGLDVDAVHLTTFYAHDYTSPTALQRGHGVHNLSALIVLDAIWKNIIQQSSE